MNSMDILPTKSEKEKFTPGWHLSDAALHVLAVELIGRKPKSIIEFGPGLTTVVFRKYCFHNIDVKLRSIDHQSAFTTPGTEVYPLGVDSWYNEPTSEGIAYDLMCIDGPIRGRSCKRALAYYRWHSNEKTIFVIDDTNREEEQAIAKFLAPNRTSIDIVDPVFKHRITTFLFPNKR